MRNLVLRLNGAFVAVVLTVHAPSQLAAGPICGPGPHWVDSCPGGTYAFPTVTNVNAVLDLDWDGTLETGPVLLQFIGSTTIFLGPGSPHSLASEVVSINETGPFGSILRAGDGVGNLASDGPLYSPGLITEQGGNPAFADSFFDVFFEIELSPIRSMRNLQPMQVRGCLTQAPPDYGALGGPCAPAYDVGNYPILLYDSRNPAILRGQLLPLPQGPGSISHHVPTPEPATFALIGVSLAALRLARRRRI